MPEITIYIKPWCGYCRRALELLDSKGLDYRTVDVIEDPAAEREMIQRSGRWTAPQIFVGDDHIGDSDELFRLEAAGKLDALLSPPGAADEEAKA